MSVNESIYSLYWKMKSTTQLSITLFITNLYFNTIPKIVGESDETTIK